MRALSPEYDADEIAGWAASAPLGDGVYTPFGPIDPSQLSQDGRLNMLLALERVRSWVDAQQARLLAYATAHPEPEFAGHEWIREEVACALHISAAVASDRIGVAESLHAKHPDTLALMDDGVLSWNHARALTDATRDLAQQIAAKVEARVLDRAPEQTPAEFRRSLRRAVIALDGRRDAERHEAEAQQRRVCRMPDAHAMSWLNCYLPAVDVATVWQAIQGVADKATTGDCRTADQRRADALVSICQAVLDGVVIGDLPRRHGRKPAIQVSVALSTLLGLDQQPGDLDGYGPIPAELAVKLAGDPTSTWRRLVTDELGRLTDYGRTTYRAPQDLADFIIARDRRCRRPGCHRDARRCELDHLVPWADGGLTNADGMHPLCPREHHLRHDAGWEVQRLPDGTTRWTTPTGRTHDKPPETYPVDRTRPKIGEDEDPPPF